MKITPMSPEYAGIWEWMLGITDGLLINTVFRFLLDRPDEVLLRVATDDTILRAAATLWSRRFGWAVNPTWIRSQCTAIAQSRGIWEEP